jgi:anionic cell wall polymer biosynthesis LytR-Cps2A-Psr (LCP) family protein
MAEKQYPIEFQPEKARRWEFMKRFLGGFIVILLLLGTVSFFVLKRDGLFERLDVSRISTVTTEADSGEAAWTYTGKATFLLALAGENNGEIRAAVMATLDVGERTLSVTALDTAKETAIDAEPTSLQNALTQGSGKRFASAAAALSGTQPDRYIIVRDTAFVKIVNLFGGITTDVPERIRYRADDFSLTIAPGQQLLQGDMLLRYLRYLHLQGEAGLEKQSELCLLFIEKVFSAQDPAKAEERFDELINIVETNVTARDFHNSLDVLTGLLTKGLNAPE